MFREGEWDEEPQAMSGNIYVIIFKFYKTTRILGRINRLLYVYTAQATEKTKKKN
jgi:hypothetical protein